jgi:hypothetical protein
MARERVYLSVALSEGRGRIYRAYLCSDGVDTYSICIQKYAVKRSSDATIFMKNISDIRKLIRANTDKDTQTHTQQFERVSLTG